jgi:hypothetical protein
MLLARAGASVARMSGPDATLERGTADGGGCSATPGPPDRVLVVFEPCDSGRAALREAAELANAGSELSVVTLAPQVKPMLWGRAGGEGPYNLAMREEAEIDLGKAREILGSVAARATFAVLAGTPQPPRGSWAAARAFSVVLLPFHRFTPGGSRLAKALRRATTAEVRLVR